MAEQIEKVVDLNVLLGTPIKVELGPDSFLLPADCPAELYLQMLDIAQAADEQPEETTLRAFRDGVLSLFKVHQPDLEQLPFALGLEGLVSVIGQVYGQGDPTPAQGNGQSSPTAEAGTQRPKPKRKRAAAKSRSSASSAT